MNLKKYKRFFAFGCSFTYYNWMTWADIISGEIPEYYNYGKPGCGNGYIYSSIIEANIRHSFTEDDLIIVMWSSVDREDRYIEGSWKMIGSITHSIDNFYDDKYLKKYFDLRGFLIRDLSYITGAATILKNLDFHFLSMMPFNTPMEYVNRTTDEDLRLFYKSTLDLIKPSVFEVVYDFNWENQKTVKIKTGLFTHHTDLHPTPKLHYMYLKKIFPEIEISQETLNQVNIQESMIFKDEYLNPETFPYHPRPHIDRL